MFRSLDYRKAEDISTKIIPQCPLAYVAGRKNFPLPAAVHFWRYVISQQPFSYGQAKYICYIQGTNLLLNTPYNAFSYSRHHQVTFLKSQCLLAEEIASILRC